MAKDNRYTIKYDELGNGLQTISFPITSDFFESLGGGEILSGDCTATLEINRVHSTLQMNVGIEGSVMVECDRCLEEVEIAVKYNGTLVVKFSSEVENIEYILDNKNEDTIIANPLVGELDLREYLYDSIILSLPLQRSHPLDAEEGEGCNPEMLSRFGVLDLSTNEWDDDEDDDEWDDEEEF